jgi:hypothetical protein
VRCRTHPSRIAMPETKVRALSLPSGCKQRKSGFLFCQMLLFCCLMVVLFLVSCRCRAGRTRKPTEREVPPASCSKEFQLAATGHSGCFGRPRSRGPLLQKAAYKNSPLAKGCFQTLLAAG